MAGLHLLINQYLSLTLFRQAYKEVEHGEGYAQEIWRELKKTREGQHVCSYESFKRNYVYVLKKLGLIEEDRREPVPSQPNWHERRYYRIVQGKEDLGDEWTNPQKV
jgi:hypothetical protein